MRRRLASPIPVFDVVPPAVVDAAKQLFDVALRQPRDPLEAYPAERPGGVLFLS